MATTSTTIGVPRRRSDGEGKVRGSTRYAADLPVHGLLHARLVLAAEAHGRIASIDGDAALGVPGVVAVLTAADLPFVEGAAGRAGQPLARAEVVYSGQPVALVVAETEAAATDGVDEVLVDIEPLEAALDLETAMAPGAPRARVDVAGRRRRRRRRACGGRRRRLGRDDEDDLSDNVAGRQRMAAGDAAAGAARRTPRVAAGSFSTSWIHQGYLEPQVATAWLEPEGGLVIAAARRAPSPRASSSPTCSAGRTTACGCARRHSAAPSAAS